MDICKLEKVAGAVEALITSKSAAELETLRALQDLMEEMTHPESELPLRVPE